MPFFFGITAGPDGAMWFVVNGCGLSDGMIVEDPNNDAHGAIGRVRAS